MRRVLAFRRLLSFMHCRRSMPDTESGGNPEWMCVVDTCATILRTPVHQPYEIYSSRKLNKMGEGQMHGRGEVGRMIWEKKVFDQALHEPQESVLPSCPISLVKWRRDAKEKPYDFQQDWEVLGFLSGDSSGIQCCLTYPLCHRPCEYPRLFSQLYPQHLLVGLCYGMYIFKEGDRAHTWHLTCSGEQRAREEKRRIFPQSLGTKSTPPAQRATSPSSSGITPGFISVF